MVDSSTEEVPAKTAGAFGTTLAGLKLKASALEDYKQVHELFTKMLLPANVNKLLAEPCREVRIAAMESFIRIS